MTVRALNIALITLVVTLVLGCVIVMWRSLPFSFWLFPERERLYGGTGWRGAIPGVVAVVPTPYSFVVVDYPDHLPIGGTGRVQVRYRPEGFESSELLAVAQKGEPVDSLSMVLSGIGFTIEGPQEITMPIRGDRHSTVEWLVSPKTLNSTSLSLAFTASLKTKDDVTPSHDVLSLTIVPVVDAKTAIREFVTNIYTWIVSLSFAAIVGYVLGKKKKGD